MVEFSVLFCIFCNISNSVIYVIVYFYYFAFCRKVSCFKYSSCFSCFSFLEITSKLIWKQIQAKLINLLHHLFPRKFLEHNFERFWRSVLGRMKVESFVKWLTLFLVGSLWGNFFVGVVYLNCRKQRVHYFHHTNVIFIENNNHIVEQ